MANGIPLNDPRLRDPIQNVPDGLNDPVQAKVPGFWSPYLHLFINGLQVIQKRNKQKKH